ncbi:hypothetical protein [Pontibacillus yanchengensis]|uniref:Uncharacterized protein n=1 Tax=Pontibacillus yanchengensis Y32 TaxID=1385514 RepID=A0A0A2TH99_9BACI|nr:hypothetical protein [Pontibacillus yanchengensis]KGP73456.1 hypothetical protein N782_05030 [Pontibacillus yanchengensis Y32]
MVSIIFTSRTRFKWNYKIICKKNQNLNTVVPIYTKEAVITPLSNQEQQTKLNEMVLFSDQVVGIGMKE